MDYFDFLGKNKKRNSDDVDIGLSIEKSNDVVDKNFVKATKGKYETYNPIRFKFVILGILAVLGYLLYGAANVTMNDYQKFLEKEGEKRTIRTQKLPAIRGSIYDRNGRLLSGSSVTYDVVLDVKAFLNDQDNLKEKGLEKYELNLDKIGALAKVIGESKKSLLKKIDENKTSRYLVLKKRIQDYDHKYLSSLKIPNLFFETSQKRYYISAEETGAIIGLVNDEGGAEGAEKSFNNILEGRAGFVQYVQDGRKNIVEVLERQEAKNGQDIYLSIDSNIQNRMYMEAKKAYIENNASAVSATLLDVKTGEIIAMVNVPSFNASNVKDLANRQSIRNRNITDVFEPGSTVKPFVVLAGLSEKVINKNTIFNTSPLVINGHTIKDVSYQRNLDIKGILQKSSNTGVSQIALSMHPYVLPKLYKSIGFGDYVGTGLVGEQAGKIPQIEKRWSQLDRATISYGYGIQITPLQLVQAYGVLGNKGIKKPVSLLKIDPPYVGNRVFGEKESETVLEFLNGVTEPLGGGGVKARVEGYEVGVKTGTAKKVEKGKYVDKYLAYTVGLAPIENPRFALVVMVDEPKGGAYYGGAVAAPVWSKMMEIALHQWNVLPDDYRDKIVEYKRGQIIPSHEIKEQLKQERIDKEKQVRKDNLERYKMLSSYSGGRRVSL